MNRSIILLLLLDIHWASGTHYTANPLSRVLSDEWYRLSPAVAVTV